MSQIHRLSAGRAGPLAKAALLGGVAFVLVVSGAGTASAQSTRQLLNRVQQLEIELEAVKQQLRNRRPPAASPGGVPPKVVRSGQKKVTLEISGQVNRAVMGAFNDDAHNLFFVDNDNSSTRFRFTGRADIDKNWTVFARIELEAQSNPSNVVNQLQKTTSFSVDERNLEFRIRRKGLGAIWVGQGDTASNTVAEKDLSGTAVVGYSNIDDTGGPRFGTSSANTAVISAPQIEDVFDNLDGLSRRDRIRFDTAKIYGFMVSASVSDDYARDVALHYSGEPLYGLGVTGKGVLKVAAGLGYFKRGTPGDTALAGSLSALHVPTGLNVTFAAGKVLEEDAIGRDKRSFWYVKGGWQFKVLPIGKTSISVDYGRSNDVRINGEEAWAVGAQLVQNVDDAGLELYVGFRRHELDSSGTGPDFGDVQTIITGARVKF